MFRNRAEAGRMLAERLLQYRGKDVVVLALPRGGVPVAAEIARVLDAPLDLMLVRKVGAPGQPELALAAIAGPDGEELVVNPEVAEATGLDAAAIRHLADAERPELARRRAKYLAGRPPVPLAGRTAILVDDGIATGATVRAALRALRRAAPAGIVLAVPVAPAETLAGLRTEVDAIICVETQLLLGSVGAYYASFPQVSDAEVIEMLAATRTDVPVPPSPVGPGGK
ncbi:phosphoribosyltransferase [Phaeovulum sp.]|uniref:phosphoribosyltransferase n=1 Tax=Phaeovulum sp. TaxID=2934796 RepID=UPI00272FE89B|nr:phosphoribosyltransferase family protein [Phaeovulum sp.]MDP1669614.1 phosphoribosyltransferase family protein [Phaeovulum sp.]MDZ4119747.1 phosphoribosyltransferase family protein [Phaeovulum sp.]